MSVADASSGRGQVFEPGSRLITAIDVPDQASADALVARLGEADWLKIGLELFIAGGPELVRGFVSRGYRVMLDLKLHDIPATVARATARAAALGVELLTLHASGGREMLAAAVQAAREAQAAAPQRAPMRLLAVTLLTSLGDGDLDAVGLIGPAEALVARQTAMAVASGCDGVVASPREVARLREAVPERFLIVTPGIRLASASADDQKRTSTPAEARAAGADLLVCGRPIRDARDPVAVADAIRAQIA
ncbi:orotidine-5'-phosphate decarboxylase [Haliangium ochraceum]|uniref:Orotidine 5'-phosphate decarboxylase n=1 Tax=Haliangium ochraceum (strain DSM 14365 / JCM 11303 / SMP-2) TaxID=502025 RepID=D0LZ98_HALO1|nr:orotidine-5'-phosphate decarboxylase [Haliangium ochraceum]ACY16360.1 orotidine 5'-phosphate decarboxylase [Haliangium ochraceum DSM 14365]